MKGKFISIKLQRTKYVVMDLATTFLAFFIFDIFRFYFMGMSELGFTLTSYLGCGTLLIEQFCIPPLLLGIYWLSGYYNQPFGKSRLEEMALTMWTAIVNTVLIYFALLINDQFPDRRLTYELVIALFLLLFALPYAGRLSLTLQSLRKFRHHDWSFNTIIIGDSRDAVAVAERLRKTQTNLGYNVLGHIHIPDEISSRGQYTGVSEAQFEKYRSSGRLDQLILAPRAGTTEEKTLEMLFKYFPTGIPIRMAPTSLSFVTSHIRIGDIFAEPFVDLTTPAISPFQRNAKRVIDVVISAVALVVLSPLLAILALLVKKSSPGPVIYRQERIGHAQKPFFIYKFRSMRTDAEASGPRLAEDDDPRVTPIGHFLRKYRLDELPQFWNVLKGDMSLVGPRPERAYYIDRIVAKTPYYTLLHQVKPGITSWGMVKYGYARTVDEMIERMRYDLIYLSSMSVAVDFKILIHTVKTVVLGKGI
ncbi:MAG: sugar transferase [Bacteroides sp.]|nr:sugar transferase [Bacteroides sp.]